MDTGGTAFSATGLVCCALASVALLLLAVVLFFYLHKKWERARRLTDDE